MDKEKITNSNTTEQQVRVDPKELGLEDVGLLKVGYSLTANDRDPAAALARNGQAILLAPGWTGTEATYTKIPGPETSIAAKILDHWPRVTVIAASGIGFGPNQVKVDVPQTVYHAETNARMMDAIITKGCGLKRDQLIIAGHSWAGLMMFYMAKLGYLRCLAIAPAALIIRKRREDKMFMNKIGAVAAGASGQSEAPDLVSSAAAIYKLLKDGLGAANRVNALKAGENVAKLVFQTFGPALMGADYAGGADQKEFQTIMAQLKQQHQEQIVNRMAAAAGVMGELFAGADLSGWSRDELIRAAGVEIYTGVKDKLVTPKDVVNFLRDLIWQLKQKGADTEAANLEAKLAQNKNSVGPMFVPDCGHMGAVFSETYFFNKLAAMHPAG